MSKNTIDGTSSSKLNKQGGIASKPSVIGSGLHNRPQTAKTTTHASLSA
jgi:hypothetical protein